jgi:hypothetical protein
MTGIQDTSSETFRQLMGNGLTYEIPKFQRDYSWETEQWDDLWQDLRSLVSGEEPYHYLGYLVLQTSDQKTFRVIDGQQRLTTLSIVVLAVLRALQDLCDQGVEPDRNRQRLETLRNSYIGYLDPVTLVPRNKLRLNRNNDSYYRTYLVPLDRPRERGINSSERLMKNCYAWFSSRVREAFQTGEALAGFVDKVVDRLFFTVIRVNDELNAFRVFETLNARGVQLSSADLLKNYLFSLADQEDAHSIEINEMEAFWGRIIDRLTSERIPEFLRTYWNSSNRSVSKNDLFKTIRKQVTTKADAFRLLRDLDKEADVYVALRDPEDDLWKGKQQVQELLRELALYQVRQPFALLMAAKRALDEAGFIRVLRACNVVSFRYNVIGGLNPNEQDTAYNEAALRIAREKRFDNEWLARVYPKDDEFFTAFANAEFRPSTRNNKLVRHILCALERVEYGHAPDPLSAQYSVEHVLPRSAGPEWGIGDDVIERTVYRLGNTTLLETSLNRTMGNATYAEKRPVYQTSSIGMTKALAETYAEWTEEQVSQRQRQMAKLAKGIWRLEL